MKTTPHTTKTINWTPDGAFVTTDALEKDWTDYLDDFKFWASRRNSATAAATFCLAEADRTNFFMVADYYRRKAATNQRSAAIYHKRADRAANACRYLRAREKAIDAAVAEFERKSAIEAKHRADFE